MDKILRIYSNDIGISFKWLDTRNNLTQIVFRDTGFHLSENEIESFVQKTRDAKQQLNCENCKFSKNCKSILLQTPSNKVSMAVSKLELKQIEDLLKGTLFQLRLNDYLGEICKN